MTDKPKAEELAAFVTSTLLAVAQGVQEAQGTQITSAHATGVFGFNAPNSIEFDVAVTAKKTGKAEGGIKVSVLGVGANAGAGKSDENTSVSRIRFVIPTNFKRTTPLAKPRRAIRTVSSK